MPEAVVEQEKCIEQHMKVLTPLNLVRPGKGNLHSEDMRVGRQKGSALSGEGNVSSDEMRSAEIEETPLIPRGRVLRILWQGRACATTGRDLELTCISRWQWSGSRSNLPNSPPLTTTSSTVYEAKSSARSDSSIARLISNKGPSPFFRIYRPSATSTLKPPRPIA